MTRFHPPIASPRMNLSLALGTVTFDAEACTKTLALVAQDAFSGTSLSPITKEVQAIAALASEHEDEKLRLAKVNIERASPLNKGSANSGTLATRRRQAISSSRRS